MYWLKVASSWKSNVFSCSTLWSDTHITFFQAIFHTNAGKLINPFNLLSLFVWQLCILSGQAKTSYLYTLYPSSTTLAQFQDTHMTKPNHIRTQHSYSIQSSSSRMRVIYHNWSATKQRLHPQSVAEISHHSVLSGDKIRQCETSSGSRHKDTDQCL